MFENHFKRPINHVYAQNLILVNLIDYTKTADVVISAIGIPNYLKGVYV